MEGRPQQERGCRGGAVGLDDFHMPVAPGDVDVAGQDRFSGNGLSHREMAPGIEALGKHLSEELRHVLNDENGQREVGRDGREKDVERRGATGRNADQDYGGGGVGRGIERQTAGLRSGR